MTKTNCVTNYIKRYPDITRPSPTRFVNEEYACIKVGMLYVNREDPAGSILGVTNFSDDIINERVVIPLYARNGSIVVRSHNSACSYIFQSSGSLYTIEDVRGNRYYCGNGVVIDSNYTLCFRVHKKCLKRDTILNTIKINPSVLLSTNTIEKNWIPKIIKEAFQSVTSYTKVKVEIGEDNPDNLKLYSPQSVPPIISDEEIRSFFAHNPLTLW